MYREHLKVQLQGDDRRLMCNVVGAALCCILLHPAASGTDVVGRAEISRAFHQNCRCGSRRGAVGGVPAMDKDVMYLQ